MGVKHSLIDPCLFWFLNVEYLKSWQSLLGILLVLLRMPWSCLWVLKCSARDCVTQCSAAEDASTGSDPYYFLSSVTSSARSSVKSKQYLVNVFGLQVFSTQSLMFTISQKEMSSLIRSALFAP